MTGEIKVLGQKPVQVSLAGQEFTIYPATHYRMNQILECAATARANSEAMRKAEETEDAAIKARGEEIPIRPLKSTPVDYGILRLICKAPDTFENSKLVEGKVPAVLTNEFWSQQVQTAEIAGLFEVFVSLLDIDKLIKNALSLVGQTRV